MSESARPPLRLVSSSEKPIYYGFDAVLKGDYLYGVERLEDMLDEIKPLHQEHWDETEVRYMPDEELRADYPAMLAAERNHRFLVFTVRHVADLRMVGNSMFKLSGGLHQYDVLQASEDTFFVTKEHRGTGAASNLLDYIIDYLTKLGVVNMGMSDKSPCGGVCLEPMLAKRGFAPVALWYRKRLAPK